MRAPRDIVLTGDAKAAITQIVAIMSDQLAVGDGLGRWSAEELIQLEARLGIVIGVDDFQLPSAEDTLVTLDIDDVALLLDGMAFTEVASADLPWIDMVRWTADFVTAELRSHWTDDEWREFTAGGR